ncbi:MAG: long-chain acyl-CoA synthetase [Myxococcota bacterium]|jgi:long-chain acyl-CoA synthetase
MGYENALPLVLENWAKTRPDGPALRELNADGSWNSTSWSEYWATVRRVGKALIKLGVNPDECVGIVSNNRKEWVYAQLGMMTAQTVPAPIYTTNTKEQVAYIINHAKARVIFCDTKAQMDKIQAGRAEGLSPTIQTIVTFDETGSTADGVMTFSELLAMGDAGDDSAFDSRKDALGKDDVAMLIYTSGTTGVPKGAEFTHGGIFATANSFREIYGDVLGHPEGMRYISYLPLCHAAEQTFTNFVGITAGAIIHFCPEISKIKDYLLAARPTVFFAVPRVWEKFEAVLRGKFSEATGIKEKLTSWATATEFACFEKQVVGKPSGGLKRALANTLVLSKVQGALGLDELVVCGSGAAPISRSTLDFFASLGIVIHEGYGMTETTGVATVQPLGRPKFGTIGQPFKCVEARIAPDDEIQLRGDNMIPSYRDMPEETAALYTDDGWLCTGDLGTIDADGFLIITGRKKDLIITAGGKNVAPAEIEGLLQSIPGVGQSVVVGDRQPYLCALIVLDEEALGELCKEAGIPVASLAEVAVDPTVRAFVEARIESDCNKKLARYQTVKKFEILDHAWSVETDELTPTLKVKRNVVNEKYQAKIDAFYAVPAVRG